MSAIDRIRVAVAAAELQGYRIVHGDWGVEWRPLVGIWEGQPRRRGITPMGAVLLHLQPHGGDDAVHPAADALETSFAWVEGFSDGFDGECQAYFLGRLDRKLYLAGLEEGMEFRFELTVRCAVCSSRHFRCEPCPLCEERALWRRERELELAHDSVVPFHVEQVVQFSNDAGDDSGESNTDERGPR